jgi:hypothetical protein
VSLDISFVFMKRFVIPSNINGVLVSGKSLDSKLPSFGLTWVASPPRPFFYSLLKLSSQYICIVSAL